MPIQYFMHLKKSYDNLNQKLLEQPQLHEIVADMKVGFDRVQIQMQQSNFEHTRILEDLALSNLNDSSKQAASKIVCDASKTRILIKLSDVENKINCRSQTCENICLKINETVRQNNILSIFSDRFHKESKQWASIHAIHQLKNEDMKIYIRYEWKAKTLIKKSQWFQIFDRLAKIHQFIFKMMMSFMRTKDLHLNHENEI